MFASKWLKGIAESPSDLTLDDTSLSLEISPVQTANLEIVISHHNLSRNFRLMNPAPEQIQRPVLATISGE